VWWAGIPRRGEVRARLGLLALKQIPLTEIKVRFTHLVDLRVRIRVGGERDESVGRLDAAIERHCGCRPFRDVDVLRIRGELGLAVGTVTRTSEVEPDRSVGFGVKFVGLGQIGRRRLKLAPVEISMAAVVEGVRILRIQPDCLVEVGDGGFVVFLLAPGDAAVVEGGRILRIQPDCLVVVGDGAVVVFLLAPDDAAAIEGERIFRIQPDCLVEVGDGVVVVFLLAPGDAAAVESVRKLRIQPDCLVVVGGS